MAFQISPGIEVREIDLTNVVPAVSASIGAMVGNFNAGPIEDVTTVSSEEELVNIFGQPTESNFIYFFQAASFLRYGRALRIVRCEANQTNATADQSGLLIKNLSVYEEAYLDGQGTVGSFAAKNAGTLGNSLLVSVCPASDSAFDNWAYKGEFDTAPATSAFALQRGGANDEMHLIVIDEDGKYTGTPGTILEKFSYMSAASDARNEDGSTNYYRNVINNQSDYIYWMDHTTAVDAGDIAATTFSVASVQTVSLGGGSDGSQPSIGQLQKAMDIFADSETVDINLFIAPVDQNGLIDLGVYTIAIAERRKDMVAFISPPLLDTVNATTPIENVIDYFNQLNSTSYCVADSTAVKVYDKYNDVYRWIPANGHMAGLCAYTDYVSDAWFSPAGLNRGQLLGVSKIASNPVLAERDDLYKARINPIVSFIGEGVVLYGDKTMLSRPSAFDRINVRRLFIIMEKAIATAAKYQLFEINDEFTRAQFRNMVEPFLRDIKGRRGLTDFLVVCDESNNTGQVIDTNNFVADIYVKPARSINYITLNFVATRTGVEFSEIVGK
jgi:phage tail sheath protein FI